MSLSKNLDLKVLREKPEFSYYFRYPLHYDDFHEVRSEGNLQGYFAAKPLYEKLTDQGRVDQSANYSGQIAIIFMPSPARSVKHARLLFTRIPKALITHEDGRRNWTAIRSAAESVVRQELAAIGKP
ncbi:MAG: hypothetical protein P8074_01520 [Anaerolineales bacterium]|jgi:hypothetical protein